MIKVVTPSSLAVSLAEAKEYARIDGADEESVIASLIRVAQEMVEDYTGRAAAETTFLWVAESWPTWSVDNFYRFPAFARTGRRAIVLGRSPLVSVASFKYVDAVGQLNTIATSSYSVDTFSLPGRVVLNSEFSLPELDTESGRPDAVQIEFKAGVANSILSQAIKMTFNHLYEQRTPVITGTIATEIPMSVKHLLRSQRVDSPFTS